MQGERLVEETGDRIQTFAQSNGGPMYSGILAIVKAANLLAANPLLVKSMHNWVLG